MANERYCEAIIDLWIKLNPHCSIEGCSIDHAGSVILMIWYSRNTQKQPLEMCIGNPPRTVIRGLKNAVAGEARTLRLTAPSGRTVIGSEERGNRGHGGIEGRDK